MIGFGTMINTGAIVAGGLIGLLTGKYLKDRFQKIIIVAMSLCVCAMSLADLVAQMLTVTDSGITVHGTYILIFSLVLGALLGELVDLDLRFERLGAWLRQKTGNAKDPTFINGFVSTTLTVCVGAMAIIGSIMDGVSGDYSILVTKSIMDFVIVIVMTASLGKGCIFSAIPIFVWQGLITVLARLISPLITDAAINNISLVGSVLILCVGINLLADGKFRIKVANLLPAVILAVAASYIPFIQNA